MKCVRGASPVISRNVNSISHSIQDHDCLQNVGHFILQLSFISKLYLNLLTIFPSKDLPNKSMLT